MAVIYIYYRFHNANQNYNTGFVGGFFDPIEIKINFSPSPEMVSQANFEQQPDATTAWMSNEPRVSPKDIIIENGNKRWRIGAVSMTQKKRVLVHQLMQLKGINQNDIEYVLPMVGME